jgi:putative transposase
LIDGVLYLVDNGCKWRALPHDYPPYSTVHTFYRRARLNGLWEKVLRVMVERTRVAAGREPGPSYGLIDSQSVKTVYASEERGIDGGKKRKGASDISSRT